MNQQTPARKTYYLETTANKAGEEKHFLIPTDAEKPANVTASAFRRIAGVQVKVLSKGRS